MPAQQVKKQRDNIHGIVLLDKPSGMSSNKVLQIVKRVFNAKKAGHTGALDPLATGLLPLCFGQATKLADYLLGQNKTYLVTAKLGERTTTSDSEGELVDTKEIPLLDDCKLEKYLEHFRGEIIQTPSMYSALKYQGKPYYYYARKGIEIERVSRPVTIFNCELLSHTADTLTLRVACSKGTYIRTLIDDLGEIIGCGAHVIALRREHIDGIHGDMVSLDLFESRDDEQFKSALLPPEAVINCDTYTLSDSELEGLRIGTLASVESMTSSDLMVLKSQDNIVFAYAQREENNHFKIARRFIHGFGTLESEVIG
jgi:tRNA pseudouridine55 synthase